MDNTCMYMYIICLVLSIHGSSMDERKRFIKNTLYVCMTISGSSVDEKRLEKYSNNTLYM